MRGAIVNKWLMTAIYLIISLILTRILPFSSFFRNVDTMCHEFSHAFVAMVLSGRIQSIELNADHSGVTHIFPHSGWSLLPIGLAGYIGAALFSLLLFYCYRRKQLKLGLIVLTAIALLMLVLFVHTGFGVPWLAGFIALNVIVLFSREWVLRFYYLFIAFLSLEESTFSTIDLARMALTSPSSAGDASGLRNATSVPSLLWALLFVAVSLTCAMLSVRQLSKSDHLPA